MMPGSRRSAKKRALIAAAIGGISSVTSMLFRGQHPVGFVYLAAGAIVSGYAAFLAAAWPRGDGHGRARGVAPNASGLTPPG